MLLKKLVYDKIKLVFIRPKEKVNMKVRKVYEA
jgi:hypothetical protein